MINTTFRNLLKKLAPEFGIMKESFDPTQLSGFKPIEDPDAKAKQHLEIEKSVLGQIDKSEKLDEVDTVTFGLETDDNKIVKVYVNAEQAVEFEKELAQKLGEIDDIEEVLNELSKKFEIIDVEWPDEEGDGEDTGSDDEPTGGESMDPKVYKKDKKFDPEAAIKKGEMAGMSEHLSYGEKAALELTESMSSIEQRLSTPSQLLIYHAILALGIPEVALTKSPYRSAIVNSIKEQAIEINKNSELKLALKGFVRYATDATPSKKAEGDVEEKDESDKKEVKKPVAKPVEKKPVEKKEEPVEKEEDDKKPVVKEALEGSGDFWTAIQSILKHVMVNETSFERLVNAPTWNRLVARSQTRVSSKYLGTIERKMSDLIKQLPSNAKEAVTESVTVIELENLFNSLFEFADPDPGKKYAADLVNAPQFRQFMNASKSVLTQRFPGAARTRMQMLLNVLALKDDKKAVAEAAIVEAAVVSPMKDEGPWTFESIDEGLSITHGKHLKMILDEENAELLSKGINNKRALVVKDVDGAKFTFSPRGVIVKVKASGTNAMCEMSAEEVSELMDIITEAATGKAKKKEEEEE